MSLKAHREALDMNLAAYYAEQDERMNLPSETIEQYQVRLSEMKRRSQDGCVISAPSTSTFVNVAPGETRNMNKSEGIHTDKGHKMKRKLSEPHPETAGKRSKVADQGRGRETGGQTDPSFSLSRGPLDLANAGSDTLATPLEPVEREGSSNLLDVRSSTKSPSNTQKRKGSSPFSAASPRKKRAMSGEVVLPSESTPNAISVKATSSPSQNSRKKRMANHSRSPQVLSSRSVLKTSSDEMQDDIIESFTVDISAPVASKVRAHARRARSPQADAEDSPIASFSKTLETLPKRQRVEDPVPVFIPPLDLRFLADISRPLNNKQASGPPTSPIEEVSTVLPKVPQTSEDLGQKKMKIAPESSRLYLKVKDRIAKHSTAKERDKILKLESKKPVKTEQNRSRVAPSGPAADEGSVIYISSSPSSRAASPVAAPPSEMTKIQKQLTKPVIEKRKVKGKKEKPQPMTPVEYARMLGERAAANVTEISTNEGPSSRSIQKRKKSSTVKFLEGKTVFYTGGDMKHASETTRGRMDIISKFGATLIPEFDPKLTTHIITDANIPPTLRALGLKSLKEIPDHIPTVTWKWLLSVLGKEGRLSKDEIERKLGDTWLYAAFRERMDAGYQPQKTVSLASFKTRGKSKILDEFRQDRKFPRNEDSFTMSGIAPMRDQAPMQGSAHQRGAPLSPPISPGRRPSAEANVTLDRVEMSEAAEDPLAQFIHEAKAEKLKDDGWSSLGELEQEDSDSEETDNEHVAVQPIKRAKRGWTCDNKEPQQKGDCPNQDIIDKLTELMQLHKSKLGDGDHWRAFSYSKCIRALRNYPRRIKSFEEARGIRGVGERTAKKIEEILQTGDLRRIKYEKTEDVQVTSLFQDVYGVGQTTAFQWYAAGCRTLKDLHDRKGGVKLSTAQDIGLRFYDDINDRMPREEAKAIFDIIRPIALQLDSKLFVEIMGSYRRGKSTCGDIDILITRPTDDGETHGGILPKLLQALRKASIITEDLAMLDEPDGLEAIYRGLCRLPDVPGSKRRRIDFLSVPWSSRGAALIYYTGDDIFNRAMRMKANKHGYSLNQRGLFSNVVRDPRDPRVKLNAGVMIASETEEEIFKILKVPWQEPHERVRG